MASPVQVIGQLSPVVGRSAGVSRHGSWIVVSGSPHTGGDAGIAAGEQRAQLIHAGHQPTDLLISGWGSSRTEPFGPAVQLGPLDLGQAMHRGPQGCGASLQDP